MAQKKIIQFGAGNIGRSLVGSIFANAGYDVVLIDNQEALVQELNKRGSYQVVVKQNDRADETITVAGVQAVHAQDVTTIAREIAEADLISTAVGASVLPLIMPTIAEGLKLRDRAVSILLCENLRNAAEYARKALLDCVSESVLERVGLVETSIGKMVPIMPQEALKEDPLVIWAEPYNQIIADGAAFAEEPPLVENLVLKQNFAAYVDRKLFVHNLGHATAAWHGFQHGKTYIWECLEDPWIRAETRCAMTESAQALARKYASEFTLVDLNGHIEDLLRRFGNRVLGDSVYRVGRDLQRKLAADDRVCGALRLAIEEGIDPEHICRTAAAGLSFRAMEQGEMYPPDAELVRMLESVGPEQTLITVCGFKTAGELKCWQRILERYAAYCQAIPA